MSDRERCAAVEDLLAEVALQIAGGEERADVLRHVSVCGACRSRLEELSAVADDLLLAAPIAEPPAGFETRVQALMGEHQPPEVDLPDRSSRRRRLGLLVGTAALAAILGAAAVFVATRSDRDVAAYTRAQLAVENGEYFEAAQLKTAEGVPAGQVFAYQGSPSWILVIVAAPKDRPYRAAIRTKDGRWVSLGRHRFSGFDAWGESLPLPFDEVDAFRLQPTASNHSLEARFEAHDPT